MLVHQAKRLHSPCFVITNQFFITAAFLQISYVQYHITRCGAEMLEVGGRLVYSTCSLNPIEDETVLQREVADFDSALQIVDASHLVHGLKCNPCMTAWKLEPEEVDEIRPSMFPLPNEKQNRVGKMWQAGEKSIIYLIYRWIWALFFAGVFIACLALQFSDGKFFIFLTNWGIILCLLTNLIAACLVTRWHFRSCEKPTGIAESAGAARLSLPMVVKLYWCLHGVTLSLAIVITTIYWAFLHGKMNKPMRYPVMSFITHCMNSVFMLLDFIVVAFPFRILHSVYAMMLPIAYCLFTVVYFFCGGVDEYGNHHVYPILDWTKPLLGITTFMGTFGLYVIYGLLLFMIYKLRRFLRRSQSTKWTPEAGPSK